MTFRSIYHHGFARIAACTIEVQLADPSANSARILTLTKQLHAEGVALAVFPELCLSGYSIDDLVQQDVVIDEVEANLLAIVAEIATLTTHAHHRSASTVSRKYLQHGCRDPSRGVTGRDPEDPSAELSRV